jgi:rare lipoprotein A
VSVPRAARFIRFSLQFGGALCALAISGCGARRPVVDHRQPPVAQPSPAPTETSKPPTGARTPGPAPSAPAGRTLPNSKAAAPALAGHVEQGGASWYGLPFHGRRASNGEIYDMHQLTAAHRTLPFDTLVRVTNLANGKSAVVRITDRGPFVENRIIDLSLAAARQLDMIVAGVAAVRLEVLSGPDPAVGFFAVQVGAFRERANADRLRERLSGSYSPVVIQAFETAEGTLYRVRAGRLASEDAARQLGETLRVREKFTPFVVRLDEGANKGGTP